MLEKWDISAITTKTKTVNRANDVTCLCITWCLCPQCSHSGPTGGPVAAEYFMLKSNRHRLYRTQWLSSNTEGFSEQQTSHLIVKHLAKRVHPRLLELNLLTEFNLRFLHPKRMLFYRNTINSGLYFKPPVRWWAHLEWTITHRTSLEAAAECLVSHCFPLLVLLPILCKWKAPQPTQLYTSACLLQQRETGLNCSVILCFNTEHISHNIIF